MLHVPRTGGTSIARSWRLGPPEYYGHAAPMGEPFRYGFARNPWDRVVSLWHLLHPAADRPFREWVLDGLRGPAYEGVPIVAPCVRWLEGATFVGRFEQRADHVAKLARILERPVPPLHMGKTDRRPYPEYYDDQLRDIVARLYVEDIRAYGYTFEG